MDIPKEPWEPVEMEDKGFGTLQESTIKVADETPGPDDETPPEALPELNVSQTRPAEVPSPLQKASPTPSQGTLQASDGAPFEGEAAPSESVAKPIMMVMQ